MATVSSPNVHRRRLSIELRQLRSASGLRHEDVANALGCSPAKISRIEAAKVPVGVGDLRVMLDLYEVTDPERREVLETLARGTKQKGWWHRYGKSIPAWFEYYLGLEAEASSIRSYAQQTVPGLLQTEAYAKAVLQSGFLAAKEVERQVQVRMERQAILSQKRPPRLWVILHETVLRQKVGGPAVMKEQLHRLVNATADPSITLQVLPLDYGAHPGIQGSFVLLDFEPSAPLAYLETAMSALYLEEPDEIEGYTLIFEHLIASALNEGASAELIASAAREYA